MPASKHTPRTSSVANPDDAPTQSGAVLVAAVDDATGPIFASARLVCVVGKDQGKSYSIGKTCLIGRANADICLSAGDVSRHHARLTCGADGFTVADLGSANGTFVNGVRVTDRERLTVGDRLQIASTILVVAHHDGLEDRLRELQRLDAITAAVSGVAHDFNNAMQTIIVGLDELSDSAGDAATIEDMKLAASAAAGLATRILNLGRNTPASEELVKLAPLVEETVRMTRRLLAPEIKITVDVDVRAGTRGSHDELQQVLTNMIFNARDAIGTSGEITITCKRVMLDPSAALTLNLPVDMQKSTDQEYIELSVQDNGSGMDSETLARALEPFFTTKPTGKGTGLGLAMVHSIVRRHRGAIDLQSRLSTGTTVRIYLPSSRVSPESLR